MQLYDKLSGLATGGGVRRAECPRDSKKKIANNWGKDWENWDKQGKIRKKRKNGEEKARVFLLPPDR